MKAVALLSGLCLAFSAAAADDSALASPADAPVELPNLTVTPIETWSAYLNQLSRYVIEEVGITAELPPLHANLAQACINLAVLGDALWLQGAANS